MRRIIVWNLMSIDGFFEGADPWDLEFHNTAWGRQLEAFSDSQGKEIGTLLFGRKTYEGMHGYWSKETGATAEMMNTTEKVVVSRSLKEASWNNSRVLEGRLPAAVHALKCGPGKDIFVFGSADLVASLLSHGLVDEYRLCIAPILLGKGTPLFKTSDAALGMKLLETTPLESGGVILRYAPHKA